MASDTPKFSFGAPASGAGTTSGASGSSLFGTAPKPGGGLFGSGGGGGAFAFGNTQTSQGGGSGLFGSTANPPASSAGGSGGLFGSAATTGGTSQPFGGAGAGFSFGGAPSTATSNAPSSTTPAKPLFGGASTGGLFGGQQAAGTPASTAAGSATPAPTKPLFSFGTTTPVNTPPPTTASQPAPGMFGSMAGQAAGQPSGEAPKSLFGGATPAASAPTPGGLFGSLGNTPASSAPAAVATPAGGPQPGNPSKQVGALFQIPSGSNQTPSLFPSQPAATSAPSAGGLFGGAGATSSTAPSTAPTSAFGGATGGFKFPGIGGSEQKPAESQTPAATQPKFSFGQQTTPAAPSATASTTAAPSLFGKPADAATSTLPAPTAPTPAATTAAPSLFGAKPAATAPTTTSNLFGALPAGASSTPASSAAPAANLFGAKPASAAGSSSTATTSAPATSTASATGTAGATIGPAAPTTSSTTTPALGASTLGPLPPASSRLKNKSMDDIITRWASDLSKYKSQFRSQAEQVAQWDRMLVENTEKISKLYTKTFHAERDAGEVERQLKAVEDQQDELEQWLDLYEKNVDEMMRQSGLDGGDGVGVDKDRERTYKLAERLTTRLDDTNRDLEEIIAEINDVSASLSRTKGPEDQLSKIVGVLNSHLSQLQTIDVNTSALRTRVAAARKEQQRNGGGLNGWSGLSSDPTEDFYKTYRSRR